MGYKIGIIGAGNVGVTYAYSLINLALDINEIILIDLNKEKTIGEVLDLNHSLTNARGYINKIKYGEYKDISDADILCITAGMSQNSQKKSRMEDIIGASKIIDSVMENVNKAKFDGIILCASNPLDIMTTKIAKLYNNQYQKIIGSGTLLETARLKYEVASKLDFPIRAISGYVLGEHGDSQFVVWSSVKINNTYPIEDYLTESEMLEIADNVKKAGFTVSSKKNYTNFGVATALTRITKCIINNENEILPVSTYDKNEDIYISNLSKIGSIGVLENNLQELGKNEEELYKISANIIKEGFNTLDK